jgi:Domain of unknown function (DUF397)
VNTSNVGPSEPAIGASMTGAAWIKSSYSGPTGGNCAEVAFLVDGQVAMRNSRHLDGPVLVFTRAEWDAFLSGARDGEFGVSS